MHVKKFYKKVIRRHKNAASQVKIIYIIHKFLVLLKITRIWKGFLRSIKDFYFFKKIVIFFTAYNDGKLNSWRRTNKDVRNIFRLKKEMNDTAIKYIRHFLGYKKKIK